MTTSYFCIVVTKVLERNTLKKEVYCGSPFQGFGPLLVGKAYLGGSTHGQWMGHEVTDRKQRRGVDTRVMRNCQRHTLVCSASSRLCSLQNSTTN